MCYNDGMVKLWFKIIRDNKIVAQTTTSHDEKFTYADFGEYIIEGCYALDVATPLIIRNHIMNFAKYNHVNFLPSDFVEHVEFDKLVVENLDR